MSANEKLRPCPIPWCLPANTRHVVNVGGYFWVRCTCCLCGPTTSTRADAITAWNTRVPGVNQKMLEALKAIVEQIPPCERLRGGPYYSCRWCSALATDPNKIEHSSTCELGNAEVIIAEAEGQ